VLGPENTAKKDGEAACAETSAGGGYRFFSKWSKELSLFHSLDRFQESLLFWSLPCQAGELDIRVD
jgi:hypothetical protein